MGEEGRQRGRKARVVIALQRGARKRTLNNGLYRCVRLIIENFE